MFILQIIGWFVFSAVLVSFIEHQVHSHLMHQANFLSRRTKAFKRTFEAHAIVHHHHYSEIFADEPVPLGEDREIQMTVYKAPIKTLPIILLIALVSWQGALCFIATVLFHHWVWNKIHLEMHKPEDRGFSHWPIYKFLARHHYLHHKYPHKNFNVVFPFADYVLGTNVHAKEADLVSLRLAGLLKPAPALAPVPVVMAPLDRDRLPARRR
jgi:hypothetical protein